MAITVNSNTGWSGPIRYNSGSFTSDDSYSTLSGTWFMRSWWDRYKWARKYVNVTDTPQKLSRLSFVACPGHSGGNEFWTGTVLRTVKGYGCTFSVQLHLPDKGTIEAASSCTLNSITQFNCYYGGYGGTCKDDTDTSFGNPRYFKPGTPYSADGKGSVDANGNKKYWHEQIFNFADAPVLAPGESMYVTIDVDSWAAGSGYSDCMLVIRSSEEYFDAVVEPVLEDYIWRMNESGIWEKVLPAHIFNGTIWEELRK